MKYRVHIPLWLDPTLFSSIMDYVAIVAPGEEIYGDIYMNEEDVLLFKLKFNHPSIIYHKLTKPKRVFYE